jgi:hypothetical protein
MKVTRKLLMVSVEVPVQVGELKCICEYQVCRNLNSRDEVDDIDYIDITDISYMGIEIKGYDNWNKFKKFHMEMGIDWNQAIEGEAMKHKSDIIDLVNESY